MKGSLSHCCCSCCHSDGDGTVTCGEPHLFQRPPSKQIIRADYTSVFISFNGEMMKIRNGRRRPGLPSAQMCHHGTSTLGSNPLGGHSECQLRLSRRRDQRAWRLAQTIAGTLFWGISWQPIKFLCLFNNLRSTDIQKGLILTIPGVLGVSGGLCVKLPLWLVETVCGFLLLRPIASIDWLLLRITRWKEKNYACASLQHNTRGCKYCLYEKQES